MGLNSGEENHGNSCYLEDSQNPLDYTRGGYTETTIDTLSSFIPSCQRCIVGNSPACLD